MIKKLNITAITNDLEGSAVFPGKIAPSHSPAPEPLPEVEPLAQSQTNSPLATAAQPKQLIPERPNAPTDQRPAGKRIITRNSFEIYEDQMDSLRKFSYQEKMEGKLGSMSGMVREAIDTYLIKKSSR